MFARRRLGRRRSWREEIPLLTGVTGWVVRNRRTRNVPNTRLDPLCMVVPGTDDEDEAFVAVPLIAHDRVVGSLNVYRTGADVAFTDEEVALVERFATMAALAYDSARQRDVLREEVRTDSLTGLLNHRGCQERLRTALAEAGERAASASSCSTSTTSSASTTPTATPRATARSPPPRRACAAVVRDSDAVGRLGGEEFVLVLPGVEAGAAREAAERARLRDRRRADRRPRRWPAAPGSPPTRRTPSTAADLLACADAALYAAKDTGRGRTLRYRADLARRPSPGEEREEIEALLRGGDALSVVFQPVLELATARVCGYEALARIGSEPLPPAERVVRAGPPRRARPRAGGRRAARRARRSRAARTDTFLAAQRQPRARSARRQVLAALPDDLSSIVIELTEHELFGAEESLLAAARAAARPRRADRARRRRLRLRRPAAADRGHARHPQARPLARARRPRRRPPSSRCWRR